ncbi:MAG: ATP-binding protein [Dehalococcoidia bacterium]
MTLAHQASYPDPNRIDPVMPPEYALVPDAEAPVPEAPEPPVQPVTAWTNWHLPSRPASPAAVVEAAPVAAPNPEPTPDTSDAAADEEAFAGLRPLAPLYDESPLPPSDVPIEAAEDTAEPQLLTAASTQASNGHVAPSSASLDIALLQICQQVGLGLVRVDGDARCWPLNDAGARLLDAIGGAAGETAPAAILEAVAHGSATSEALDAAVSADTRHISADAIGVDGGSVVALRDHTEERLLQERLLQSEKMASVGQLVSGVAHELNNPLTGVMGFAQLLLARELEETVRAQIQTIYGEAERAAKIVQNLLSFARRRKPTKEMADINALLQRVLELRSYDFTIRNISLDMTMDARMDRVWVDPDQIQQVFFNLIKNAEQAMIDSHGGGRLTVVTRGLPQGVRISIADDGPGIPLDVQRRIFDPFFTTKEAGQGTGLGLTICYSIIDEHGGRIWTENLPAGGAVFHIDLPLSTGEEREPEGSRGGAAAEISLPPAISGRSILVVDDEESIRLLLHDILRLDRHNVKVARSGLEAAEITRHERFDVIITDMKMPGLDGASFYRQVRERDPEQARRIIFITGDTVSPDTRAFLQRVSNPVLSKPFKIGPLRDAIETVLGQV